MPFVISIIFISMAKYFSDYIFLFFNKTVFGKTLIIFLIKHRLAIALTDKQIIDYKFIFFSQEESSGGKYFFSLIYFTPLNLAIYKMALYLSVWFCHLLKT